jgi:acyl-CoA thioester hydrolase
LERARSDMMRALGLDHAASLRAGEGAYAVAEVALKYRRPALLDDALLVLSTVEALSAATSTIHQRVMRGDELIAEATIVAAFLSPDRRPRRQPKAWLDRFRPYLQGEETT